ncbi:MAG: hypothetical protein M1160_01670 [Candidatus Marsarchaeota archaeon]|jgi:hypothetical protein|nr:hypothetical protein [Candidatus Marsarchaeota archaeon]MCL5111572.1 hypothetical protein [Candidatus Marsarchaeota archaeon]
MMRVDFRVEQAQGAKLIVQGGSSVAGGEFLGGILRRDGEVLGRIGTVFRQGEDSRVTAAEVWPVDLGERLKSFMRRRKPVPYAGEPTYYRRYPSWTQIIE